MFSKQETTPQINKLCRKVQRQYTVNLRVKSEVIQMIVTPGYLDQSIYP